jgi:hypothetical protein
MFRGDHPDLRRVLGRARSVVRTGSEHLLLALCAEPLGEILARHGVTERSVAEAVLQAAPMGAGAAADRETLAVLGVDVDALLNLAVLDRPPAREPLLPFGGAKARRRCARLGIGLDAQAAYEASLRLALARRDREHRPQHLALTLVALDPGVAWVLDHVNVDAAALLADLAAEHPATRWRPGRRSMYRDLVRRYENTTGRSVTPRDRAAWTALLGVSAAPRFHRWV